ncbi:MAG TPA: bifunctional riboflavin kinase/FAD synthetase [Acidimicrobiales bacterium]|nr:bifunctional riboflavin kinase/FAD synthetase [Acidimicrobiales bacterium]
MEVVGPEDCTPPGAGAAVTIGAYDGVHLGHRFVIAQLQRQAAGLGLATVVVTFDRHPAMVVRPESAPRLLTDLPQKLELLAECGVDRTLVVPFDEGRSNESAEDFVRSTLVGALGARLVVVGEDFHFGHGRKGNVALMRELGTAHGFVVSGVALAKLGRDGPVSSTRIRQLLGNGDVLGAAELLGRPHQVRGEVVAGERRGARLLGFPTANVVVPGEIALPADGVYAGRYARPDGSLFDAAIAIGPPPTFPSPDGSAPRALVEAYLLDFEGDLYGEPARVSFVARLRAQARFSDVAELVAQMHRDVAETRRLLGTGPTGGGPIGS